MKYVGVDGWVSLGGHNFHITSSFPPVRFSRPTCSEEEAALKRSTIPLDFDNSEIVTGHARFERDGEIFETPLVYALDDCGIDGYQLPFVVKTNRVHTQLPPRADEGLKEEDDFQAKDAHSAHVEHVQSFWRAVTKGVENLSETKSMNPAILQKNINEVARTLGDFLQRGELVAMLDLTSGCQFPTILKALMSHEGQALIRPDFIRKSTDAGRPFIKFADPCTRIGCVNFGAYADADFLAGQCMLRNILSLSRPHSEAVASEEHGAGTKTFIYFGIKPFHTNNPGTPHGLHWHDDSHKKNGEGRFGSTIGINGLMALSFGNIPTEKGFSPSAERKRALGTANEVVTWVCDPLSMIVCAQDSCRGAGTVVSSEKVMLARPGDVLAEHSAVALASTPPSLPTSGKELADLALSQPVGTYSGRLMQMHPSLSELFKAAGKITMYLQNIDSMIYMLMCDKELSSLLQSTDFTSQTQLLSEPLFCKAFDLCYSYGMALRDSQGECWSEKNQQWQSAACTGLGAAGGVEGGVKAGARMHS